VYDIADFWGSIRLCFDIEVLPDQLEEERVSAEIAAFATAWCMEDIKGTLQRARVSFDGYFNEKSLYSRGAIEKCIEELKKRGFTYESEGALWLASSRFGDDKDRVLVKSDGSYTYMGPDLAYHRDKWERGFRTAVDVLGADHAGYPPRIRAGLVALGLPPDFLDVELIRLVKLMRAGERSIALDVARATESFDRVLELLPSDHPDRAYRHGAPAQPGDRRGEPVPLRLRQRRVR
jgi:arginyl-tRNA synthetase